MQTWTRHAPGRVSSMCRGFTLRPRARAMVRLVAAQASGDADDPRPVGCSELYSMTESINQHAEPVKQHPAAAQEASPAERAPLPSEGLQASTEAAQKGPGSSDKVYGATYYQGLLSSDLRQDNQASSSDMLKRSLQLAGGATALIGLLLAGFLASNGLLPL